MIVNNNGIWFAYLGRKDGKTVRASTHIRVGGKAERIAAEAVAARLRLEWHLNKHGLTTAPMEEAPTFGAFAARWEGEWGKLQRGYEGRIAPRVKQLVAQFGAYRLTDITPDLVHTWRVQRLDKQIAPRTINRDIDVLKAILSKGVPRYYAVSPLKGMRRLPAPPPVTKTLDPAHEKKLLEVLSPEDAAIFLVALDSLVRLGDVLALRWEDVVDGLARIRHSKNGRAYVVPLSTRAQAALAAIRPAGAQPSDAVFPTTAQTEKQRTDSFLQRVRRTCKAHGVPFGKQGGGVTFHAATRHTGATRLVACGVDLRTVQEIGGWTTMAMLSRYVHPAQEMLKAAVEKIGAARLPSA